MPPRKPTTIGEEIREFVVQVNKLVMASRVHSVIQAIVANASDHLLLRARESDRLQADRALAENDDRD